MILACLAALFVGSHVVLLSLPLLSIALAAVFVAVWSLTAGNLWWIPILTGGTILGVFKIGVKVSPIEVAFVLGMLGLAPLVMVRAEKALQPNRRALPLIFYLTGFYILVRLGIDVIPAQGARGNLGRVLFEAIWPFVFGFLFHLYGNLTAARVAIGVMFVALCVRCGAAILGYLTSIPLYIPGINYVLSFSSEDSLTAMRAVAITLMVVSLLLFHASRGNPLARVALAPIIMGAGILVIMGASRFSSFIMFFLPLSFFCWSRNWLPLLLAAVVSVSCLAFINLDPDSLSILPPVAERSLSGLVIGRDETGIHTATSSSDAWHQATKDEGFRRLTQSPLTVLFGYGIRPSPDLYEVKSFMEDPKAVVELAANTGSYESGFWCMLALFGVVGFGLYTLLFLYLWRQTFPYLFRRPVGTLWEGILFWGCYSSVIWYVSSYFAGGFPSMELFLMILAMDVIQDGRLEQEPATVPLAERPVTPMHSLHAGYARTEA